MVDRLETAGFVRRDRDAADCRKVLVVLVPEGMARLAEHYREQGAHLAALLAARDVGQLQVIRDPGPAPPRPHPVARGPVHVRSTRGDRRRRSSSTGWRPTTRRRSGRSPAVRDRPRCRGPARALGGTEVLLLTDDDLAHMKKVTGYVKRHLAQEPSIEDSRWRYSLMNWGHGLLKK